MIRLDDLLAKVTAYVPPGTELEVIHRAYVYSAQLHKERFSPTGTLVLQDALEVSDILADFRMDVPCIVAGMLHDVLQEELADPESLRGMVGEDVAGLVEKLASLSKASFHGSISARAEHMRQMILASTRDLRVILILLAARLQMLRASQGMEEEPRRVLARETLAIYSPIAHRLGVYFLKAELEDRAFQIVEPETYAELKEAVARRISERRAPIEQINTELTDLLEIHGIRGQVLGRTKSLYSTHEKMQRDKVGLERIYDLLASRIILERKDECYKMLGLIHAAYSPLPGKFKDYIALAKPNGYQSLHTCVFGPSGDIFEIQIRTHGMHDLAELGVAAHYVYKDGALADEGELANVHWFRRLLENLKDGLDPQESMELVTQELETDHIFVFTPAGEVIKLDKGATPIDFAYAIHTEVGAHCSGAKMNGRMISIRTPLEDGATVEILTTARQTPTKDWLNHAVSAKALTRIRATLRAHEREEAIRVGRERVAREVRPFARKVEELLKVELFQEWMHRGALSNLDDLYAAVGAERVAFREAMEKLFAEPLPAPPPPARAASRRPVGAANRLVTIAGAEGVMMRFAKCCAPGYGSPIEGVVTRGRGISIHAPGCHNLSEALRAEGRVVAVQWLAQPEDMRPVTLAVRAATSAKELTAAIRQLEEGGAALVTPGRMTSDQGGYTQHLTLMVGGEAELEQLLGRLNAREGIRAERVGRG